MELGMYSLRDYQVLGKRFVYQKIRDGKRKIIYWMPTGTGKGLAMSDMANDVVKSGKKVITVLRRRELIFQTRDNYSKYHKHEASIIMGAEKGYLHWSFTQICSIDTIRVRMKERGTDQAIFLQSFDVIIIDECHDCNSATYQDFFKWIDPDDKKIFIGFTATPFSMGGKPLLFWEDIIQPLTAGDARDRGYLVPDITFIPAAQIDLSGIEKNSTGDFNEAQLFERARDNVLIGNIIDTWIEKAENRPTMFFGVNKEHIRLVNAAFLLKGISSMCIDDSTPTMERKLIREKSRSGECRVVCSVGVLTTGADWPWISCIDLGRATDSLVLFIQIIGRGLRPFKVCASCGNEYGGDPECFKCKSTVKKFEKEGCIVLDHGSNVIRHGLIYEDRKAKLAHAGYESKTKNNEAPNVRITTCHNCFAVYAPSLPCCPLCATVNKPSLVIKEKGGELKLIDEATMKKLQLNRCLSRLHELQLRASWYNWKPAAVWFKLHKECGDIIFEFESDLGLPSWVKNRVGIVEVQNE
jgi:DNA repair protein RadD